MKRACFALGMLILVGLVTTNAAQKESSAMKKKLTVMCYWQNHEAYVFGRLSSQPTSDGCEKYKDATHCKRTTPDMLGDAMKGGRDWERVSGEGQIYTISCKSNCKKLPVQTQSYDVETDGKWMWITFERPDNKNLVETFEVFDISPVAEPTNAKQAAQ